MRFPLRTAGVRPHHAGLLVVTVVVAALLLPLVAPCAAVAAGFTGDVLYEVQGGAWPYFRWRGMSAKVWCYPDWYIQPGSERLSSVYVHEPHEYRPVEGGWALRGWRHIEAGIIRSSLFANPKIFWQYNNDYWSLGSSQTDEAADAVKSAYTQLELNNVTMSGTNPQRWKAAWNGHVMADVYLNMLYGQTWLSTERGVAGSSGDDPRSSIRDCMKKDSNGNWSYFGNVKKYPIYQDDYVIWKSYSASHWYSQYRRMTPPPAEPDNAPYGSIPYIN